MEDEIIKTIVISEKIRDHRKKNGITQEEFGERFGVTPQTVSKWERLECYPDITLLPELAAVLECSIDDFYEAKE